MVVLKRFRVCAEPHAASDAVDYILRDTASTAMASGLPLKCDTRPTRGKVKPD